MKISKILLHAMVVALATGTISSCQKQKLEKSKKAATEKPKPNPESCPACGMG
jgi:hypothetical protein